MSKSGRVDNKALPKVHPSLNASEAQKVKESRSNRLSAADHARLASQAGFQKLGARKKARGFDLGDASGAPIPLPSDDVDPDEWSQEALDAAQENLALAAAALEQMADGEADLALGVLENSFLPTPSDVEVLQGLAERESGSHDGAMQALGKGLKSMFGIDLKDVPMGQQVLAAGLVVAGESELLRAHDLNGAAKPAPDGTEESADNPLQDAVKTGVKRIAEKGNQAVAQAQKMNKGIHQQVNYHRTFVVKR